MSVVNPRNRLVNFRLSEVEFEKLKSACQRQGARSLSEFARSSVLRVLDDPGEAGRLEPERVRHLDHKVSELEIRVEQLIRLLSGTGGLPIDSGSAHPGDGSGLVPAGVHARKWDGSAGRPGVGETAGTTKPA